MSRSFSAYVEAALIAALAMALSFIPDFVSWFSPSFGAIPLVIFSLRRGAKYGLLSGLIWGLLHFVLAKVYYLSLSQVILEYIIAFLAMGLAGLFIQKFQTQLKNHQSSKASLTAIIAATFCVTVRYFIHYIAGIIFWGSYAPEGMPVWLYSLSVNGIAGLLTLIFVLIVLVFLIYKQPKIFIPKN